MLHKCYSVDQGGCLAKNRVCKKGFFVEGTITNTRFTEDGFPIYAKPEEDDLPVVPHNRDILLDWKGHANVEFAASTYTVLYLYSYLFKVATHCAKAGMTPQDTPLIMSNVCIGQQES